MINGFCLGMYVVMDEICGQSAFLFKKPGPPRRSDGELITIKAKQLAKYVQFTTIGRFVKTQLLQVRVLGFWPRP